MLISLQQHEIEAALLTHIGETAVGLDLSVYDISIKLIAGRSGNGLRAEIDLAPKGTVQEPAPENDATSPAAEAPSEEEDSAEQVIKSFSDFDD